MKRLWMVRLGRAGEFEPLALESGLLSIGFGMTQNLGMAADRLSVLKIVEDAIPEEPARTQANYAAQINQFVNTMAVGDLVVTPLKSTSKLAFAEVAGPYQQLADGRAARPVKWLNAAVPRDAFKQDLLYSFGAIMTVCEIRRNDAVNRVVTVLKTGRDLGDGVTPSSGVSLKAPSPDEDQAADTPLDLEEAARDQIERRIASVYAGHAFTRLIEAILEAQGYVTRLSPPGPDLGIDIVAGQGALGFGSPRLVVQVKSGDITVDQPTLQSLLGCITDTHAEQGLLVSWSGFKPTVQKRVNELFFRVRLWGRKEIVDALLGVYDQLPEDIRAFLPLRRTWTLVAANEEG